MDNSFLMKNYDYAVAALVGFLVGVFAIPTLVNLGVRSHAVLIALPIAALILFVFGIGVARILSRWLPIFNQLGRFAAVGFLNTTIDFGILNILSLASGITTGLIVGGINIPGFAIAVINSYFWNKYWVFKDRDRESVLHDFPKFLAVSVVGLFLNSGIVTFVSTYMPYLSNLPQSTWLNVAKAAATVITLAWNFLGYKFLVFRQNTDAPLSR